MTFVSDSSLRSVKGNVAGILREEIVSGRLAPGERIVEGKWANKLRVAQASVREALNILAAEGFVQKGLGRSACVTVLSEDDVIQVYQVRTSLESLSARLVALRQPDLSDLDQVIEDMQSAVNCGNIRTYVERDLGFHLALCEKSGNRFLLEHLRRLIVPLFAFIVMRQHASSGDPDQWHKSYEDHKQMLRAIRTGDPDVAEREVTKMVHHFAEGTIGLLGKQRTGAETFGNGSADAVYAGRVLST